MRERGFIPNVDGWDMLENNIPGATVRNENPVVDTKGLPQKTLKTLPRKIEGWRKRDDMLD